MQWNCSPTLINKIELQISTSNWYAIHYYLSWTNFDQIDLLVFLLFISRNVVKAFYTAGVIADTLLTFGELSVETADKRKYAKYKAAYIHTCLKNGEMPVPGPPTEGEGEGEGESDDNNAGPGPSNPGNNNGSFSPPQAPASDPEPQDDAQPSPPPAHSPIEFKPHPNPTEINGETNSI